MPATCAIHQPNLFPRLSTLAKIYAADTWVVLDSVQFSHRDYQHRARLARLADPASRQWLTLPVHRPDGQRTRISDVRLADPAASQRRMARLLQEYYGRSPHWTALRERIQPLLALMTQTSELVPVAEASARILLDLLDWPGAVLRSSEMDSRAERSARLADLSRAAGAAAYLCGTGGARYLDHRPFAAIGIDVRLCAAPVSAGVWAGARHVTGLWAVMQHGPAAVRGELQRLRETWLTADALERMG